jgi:hypothetical protein
MNAKWYVRDHLVVNELVLFGDHYRAIKDKDPTEFIGFEDVHLLKIALSAVDNLFYLESETGMLLMKLGKPDIPKVLHGTFPDCFILICHVNPSREQLFNL